MRSYWNTLALTVVCVRMVRRGSSCLRYAAALFVVTVWTAEVSFANHEADERIPFTGVPRREWLVAIDDADSQLVAAKLVKSPTELALRASISGDRERTLISGIVVFEDGSVSSSPLQPLAYSGADMKSSTVARSRLVDLQRETVEARERVKSLERQMERVSAEKRAEAGLHEVDEVYQRIAALEEKIQALRNSGGVE